MKINDKQCILPLEPTDEELEIYRTGDKNVIQVRVQLGTKMVFDPSIRVEISMSRDAMIGFGWALLREALAGEGYPFWHIRPSDKHNASESLGVFMHPSSCELLVACVEHGTLESLINPGTLTANSASTPEILDSMPLPERR